MKKLSKKQNLIILISIMTVIVIIGIVIGANVIKTNIANGDYNSSNGSSNNGNLIPEYIKKGITLGGVTGTLESLDTSDATAKPEDIALGKVAYARGERIVGTRAVEITNDESYTGNYIDLNGDNIPEGIIYADLAVGGSGSWDESYTIPTGTGFKSYQLVVANYDGPFGKRNVIKPTGSGNDRFYVMALNDIDSNSHYWYCNNYSAAQQGFTVRTSNDFGTGRDNTAYVIQKWSQEGIYGMQNNNDIWGLIQNEVEDNWFVPSKNEFIAFAGELNIDKDNYLSYGLKKAYWTSSRTNKSNAECIEFDDEVIAQRAVDSKNYVRLSTTI